MNKKPLNRSKPVDINELPDVACPVCGCTYFQPTTHIKMVSRLHSSNPSGKDQPVVHQVFCCMGQTSTTTPFSRSGVRPCGHIIDLSRPATYRLAHPITVDPSPATGSKDQN